MASKINNVGVGKPGDKLVKGMYDRVPPMGREASQGKLDTTQEGSESKPLVRGDGAGAPRSEGMSGGNVPNVQG